MPRKFSKVVSSCVASLLAALLFCTLVSAQQLTGRVVTEVASDGSVRIQQPEVYENAPIVRSARFKQQKENLPSDVSLRSVSAHVQVPHPSVLEQVAVQSSSIPNDGRDIVEASVRIVKSVHKNTTEAAEAKDLETHPGNLTEIMDVLNSAASSMSVYDAVHNGDVITADKIESLTGASEDGCTGNLCFQGDMMAESLTQFSLFQKLGNGKVAGTPWPMGVINFCFASDVIVSIQKLFSLAFLAIEGAVPCITFRNVGNPANSSSTSTTKSCGSSSAVFIQTGSSGCWSYVGITSLSAQALNLGPGCEYFGIATHELGHSLGMAHEHSRPDRDKYISLQWANINPSYTYAFDVDPSEYVAKPYDYLSVMHYGAYAFSVNGAKTITTLGGAYDTLIGQRVGLSQPDAVQLADMYGCTANSVESAKKGCNDVDVTMCSALTVCENSEQAYLCCGCGGGITYQCVSGQTCATPVRLPTAPTVPTSPSLSPVVAPTPLTLGPTVAPTPLTLSPTVAPTPTPLPTVAPTRNPTTVAPTRSPTLRSKRH